MNTINYNQTGGFPLDANILDFQQNSTKIFNQFGELAGNYSIISGCEDFGTNIGKGVIYVNGELFDFKEGAMNATIHLVEESTNLPFENGEIRPVEIKRYYQFGSDGVTDIKWALFKRPDPMLVMMARLSELEKKASAFTQGGGMLLWNKPATDIPTGWAEVVDWRGKMPVGWQEYDADFGTIGQTGGAKTKQLSVAEMPPHNHAYQRAKSYGSASGNAVGHPDLGFDEMATSSTGGGQAFSILNPYRVVLFIEYVG